MKKEDVELVAWATFLYSCVCTLVIAAVVTEWQPNTITIFVSLVVGLLFVGGFFFAMSKLQFDD